MERSQSRALCEYTEFLRDKHSTYFSNIKSRLSTLSLSQHIHNLIMTFKKCNLQRFRSSILTYCSNICFKFQQSYHNLFIISLSSCTQRSSLIIMSL